MNFSRSVPSLARSRPPSLTRWLARDEFLSVCDGPADARDNNISGPSIAVRSKGSSVVYDDCPSPPFVIFLVVESESTIVDAVEANCAGFLYIHNHTVVLRLYILFIRITNCGFRVSPQPFLLLVSQPLYRVAFP